MRVYEELFIVKPDTPEEEVDAFIDQMKDLIVQGKGSVEKAERWGGGVRKLAYRVQKYQEGLYILLQFASPAELVKEVERKLRVSDIVIKFITVRVDERLKKIEKRKKARAKRAARKPQPVAAPASAAPEHGPVPGLPGKPAEPLEPKIEPLEADVAPVAQK
ncbi:MAG TPA: 30S ribosomal protein S6 [Bryobacteraceae bacterium]|nr:30S ribosomal protein S6 [Bryobacteraceae bacterium]